AAPCGRLYPRNSREGPGGASRGWHRRHGAHRQLRSSTAVPAGAQRHIDRTVTEVWRDLSKRVEQVCYLTQPHVCKIDLIKTIINVIPIFNKRSFESNSNNDRSSVLIC